MENNKFQNQQMVEETSSKKTEVPWVFGVILTLLGAILLMRNTGILPNIGNWWALFILIPASAGYSAAFKELRDTGTMLQKTRSGLIFSVLLTVIAAIFLFQLDIRIFGPMILILFGLSIFLNNFKNQ